MSTLEETIVSILTPDPPPTLPVDYLSLSSLRMFMRCPESWRRRYIEKELEPPSGKMVLGSAAGASLTQHYGTQIETGAGISTEQLLDEFSAEWDDRTGREEVAFGSERPGDLKDSGSRALRLYHKLCAPGIVPISVEREFELSWPTVDWRLTGFIDLETADGEVADYKLAGRRMTQADADADLQPTTYLLARRAERDPARAFRFHVMTRTQKPSVELIATQRSERQLDSFTARVFTLAREIQWRYETGNWSGASPNTWFCGQCRYAGCPLRLGPEL